MRRLHMVVPSGLDDAEVPSGGNRYDRRVIDGLRSIGWDVTETAVTGHDELAHCLSDVFAGEVVVIDGLIASAVPSVLARHATRLRIVTLMHLPRGVADPAEHVVADERAALGMSAAVVTTSEWTRDWLVDHYRLPPERLHVAPPGVDPAEQSERSAKGDRLLCVGTVAAHKGQDVLIEALGQVRGDDWTCQLVGPLDRSFVSAVRERSRALGIQDRLSVTGPKTRPELAAAYRSADVVIVPSRIETFGMVVTEAISHGLPVIASDVGGIPEALGGSRGDLAPGLLVPPVDVAALAEALDRWLADAGLRDDLRARAAARRRTLTGWDATVTRMSQALAEVAA